MGNVKIIDPNQFFTESKKAIQIALEKERALLSELPKENKLALIKQRKKETNSIEEYEAIEKLEKQLEKDIKFNFPIPLIPDDYKDVIKRNMQIEATEVVNKLREFRKELKKQLPYLQNTLLPLLINIHELKKLSVVPINIDTILDFEHHEGNGLRAESFVRKINKDSKSKLAKDLEILIKEINKITVQGEESNV